MRYAPWIKWLGGVRRIRPQMRKDLIAASGDSSWITPEVMDGYIAGAAADLDGTLLAFLAMSEARERERLAPHLKEIRCPVRLVVGTAPHKGGVEQKQVRLLREQLSDFTIDSVPGAGQYLFEEQPVSVVRIIEQYDGRERHRAAVQSEPPPTSLPSDTVTRPGPAGSRQHHKAATVAWKIAADITGKSPHGHLQGGRPPKIRTMQSSLAAGLAEQWPHAFWSRPDGRC